MSINFDFLNQVAAQFSSRGWVYPVLDLIHIIRSQTQPPLPQPPEHNSNMLKEYTYWLSADNIEKQTIYLSLI